MSTAGGWGRVPLTIVRRVSWCFPRLPLGSSAHADLCEGDRIRTCEDSTAAPAASLADANETFLRSHQFDRFGTTLTLAACCSHRVTGSSRQASSKSEDPRLSGVSMVRLHDWPHWLSVLRNKIVNLDSASRRELCQLPTDYPPYRRNPCKSAISWCPEPEKRSVSAVFPIPRILPTFTHEPGHPP